MQTRLKKVATVTPGYPFRRRIIPDKGGEFQVIQGKDFDANFHLVENGVTRINLAENMTFRSNVGLQKQLERYLILKGDVMFLSRGTRTLASAITISPENTVAAGSFHVIRPELEKILPDYLAWWINQPRSQSRLKVQTRGTHISFVSIADLEDLKIEIPLIETQQKIVNLLKLKKKEALLMQRQSELSESLINFICNKAVKS